MPRGCSAGRVHEETVPSSRIVAGQRACSREDGSPCRHALPSLGGVMAPWCYFAGGVWAPRKCCCPPRHLHCRSPVVPLSLFPPHSLRLRQSWSLLQPSCLSLSSYFPPQPGLLLPPCFRHQAALQPPSSASSRLQPCLAQRRDRVIRFDRGDGPRGSADPQSIR